jgi:hypothetical protein
VEHLLVVVAFVAIETTDGRWCKEEEGAKAHAAGGDVTTSPARQQDKRNMAEAPLLFIIREEDETIILVTRSSGAEWPPCG